MIAAVGAVAGHVASQKQAKFQQKVQDRNSDNSNKQAIKSANSSNEALAAARQERALSDADAHRSLSRQVANARGTARLGGAGRSTGAVLADLAAQESSGRARIERSSDFAAAQSNREADAIHERARGRSLGQYAIPQPSLALAAINYAGSKTVTSYIDKTFG